MNGDDLRLLANKPSRSSGSTPPPPIAAQTLAAGIAGAPIDARAALEASLVALFEEEHPSLHQEIEKLVFRTAYTFSEKNQRFTTPRFGSKKRMPRPISAPRLRIGKTYSRLGLFWDNSFYGNVQVYDGLKLDPDYGLSLDGDVGKKTW